MEGRTDYRGMTQNYEIRIGKYLQEAWQNFLKAPEIYIVISVAYFASQWIFSHVPFAGQILSLLVGMLFSPALLIVADKTHERGKGSFEDLKSLVDLLPQIAALSIVSGVIILVGMVFLILPGIYLAVAYAFASQFVLFKKMEFWPAMETSRKLVNQSWFAIFGLCFVVFCVAIVGLLALGVGLLVSLPVAQLMLYYAFRDIQAQAGQS